MKYLPTASVDPIIKGNGLNGCQTVHHLVQTFLEFCGNTVRTLTDAQHLSDQFLVT